MSNTNTSKNTFFWKFIFFVGVNNQLFLSLLVILFSLFLSLSLNVAYAGDFASKLKPEDADSLGKEIDFFHDHLRKTIGNQELYLDFYKNHDFSTRPFLYPDIKKTLNENLSTSAFLSILDQNDQLKFNVFTHSYFGGETIDFVPSYITEGDTLDAFKKYLNSSVKKKYSLFAKLEGSWYLFYFDITTENLDTVIIRLDNVSFILDSLDSKLSNIESTVFFNTMLTQHTDYLDIVDILDTNKKIRESFRNDFIYPISIGDIFAVVELKENGLKHYLIENKNLKDTCEGSIGNKMNLIKKWPHLTYLFTNMSDSVVECQLIDPYLLGRNELTQEHFKRMVLNYYKLNIETLTRPELKQNLINMALRNPHSSISTQLFIPRYLNHHSVCQDIAETAIWNLWRFLK